jgi:iron complex transport system substrate-binding protein
VRRRVFLGCPLSLLCAGCESPAKRSSAADQQQKNRIVSLAPSITEALFAIGAGPDVVAVSDYCDSPAEVQRLPRLGTGITPNYEGIAKLDATLIVTEANATARRRELEAIGTTRLLPWLTLHEIAESIRELGKLTGHRAAGDELGARLLARLDVPEPKAGPRVLLVLGGEADPGDEIWFIRKNSLHGAALHAAGARNAVAEAVSGPPRLAHERLLALDPDAIVILARPKDRKLPPAAARKPFDRFVTLRAVREHKIDVLEAPEAFANGPRILVLVDKLRASLTRLGVVQ